MRIAVFGAVIVATQIGCTWWIRNAIREELSPIHYNTAFVKFAVDDWESGKTKPAVFCSSGDPDADAVMRTLPAH